MTVAALLAVVIASAQPEGPRDRNLPVASVEPVFALSGFVKPVFSAIVRSSALPEDRFVVGVRSSQAGIVLQGRPLAHWRYRAFFVLGGSTVPALVGAAAVDTDNDGAVDRIDTTTRAVLGDLVRETSVSFVPTDAVAVRAGQMPVPFTSTAQSSDVALLFVDRAGPNELFLAADDLGALLELQSAQRTLLAKVGVFNGTGTGPSGGQRGVLYLARLDLQPLGELTYDETDPSLTEARFGVGAGLIWHPYQAFDAVGFPRVRVHDLRATASVRFGFAGLSVALEGLHRHQTDDLTSRPVIASGAYAQAGWRLPIAVEPIGRIGWAAEDRSFDPRTTLWTEGGLNLYASFRHPDPERRDDLRVTLIYQGEHRITEGESAHGGLAAVLLRF